MPRALIVAGSDVAGEGLAGIRDRLTRLGVQDQIVAPEGDLSRTLEWLANNLRGRTLLVDASALAAEAAIGQLVDDPAVTNGVLIRPGPVPPGETPVRVRQKRIVSAGTLDPDGAPLHRVDQPGAASLGVLVISEAALPGARDLLRAAAVTAGEHGWSADPIDVAVVALVRGQVPMSAVGLVGPGIRRGSAADREQVAMELAGLDEARVLLERANRPDDGFYSTFVLRKLSKPLTSAALRLHLTPNQISLFSLAVGLFAAVCFAVGTLPAMVIGALALQASLTIDCVDGEVARFTRSFSAFGAWLDAATDRVKEYAAYAGLAWGAASQHDQDVWLLAALVMVMQTVRHIGDYDFSRVQRIRESWVPASPLATLDDGGAGGGGATLELSAQLNQRQGVRWFKKVLHMPIGERWLLISLGAILLGPLGTFLLLLVVGLVALAYTTAGRIMRSRTWHHGRAQSGHALLDPQLDLGLIGESLWDAISGRRYPLASAFGWAVPALMRVVEFTVVLGLALWLNGWVMVAPASAAFPVGAMWVFLWLFTVAFHHYDTLYRALGGLRPPDWLVSIGLGWDGRSVVVALVAIAGAGAFTGLMQWGGMAFFALFVVAASVQWVRQMRGRGPIDG